MDKRLIRHSLLSKISTRGRGKTRLVSQKNTSLSISHYIWTKPLHLGKHFLLTCPILVTGRQTSNGFVVSLPELGNDFRHDPHRETTSARRVAATCPKATGRHAIASISVLHSFFRRFLPHHRPTALSFRCRKYARLPPTWSPRGNNTATRPRGAQPPRAASQLVDAQVLEDLINVCMLNYKGYLTYDAKVRNWRLIYVYRVNDTSKGVERIILPLKGTKDRVGW
jgi:hypothetical protein